MSEVGSSLLATGYQQVRSVVTALAGDRAGAAQRDQGLPAAAMCATNRDLLAIASRRQLTPSVPERLPVRRRPQRGRLEAHRAMPGIDQPASFRGANPDPSSDDMLMMTPARTGAGDIVEICG